MRTMGGDGQAQRLRRGLVGQQFGEPGLLLRAAVCQDRPGNERAGLSRYEGIVRNDRRSLQRFVQA